ncbi:amidohydrolase family protein [Escherichia sp. MAL-1]
MHTRSTLIKNAMVITGDNRKAYLAKAIVIDDGKIQCITTDEHHQVPDEQYDQTIDASGMWLMPGLIDGHCHLSFGYPDEADNDHHRGTFSAEYGALKAARNAKMVLMSGVTGISVPGGAWFTDVAIRDAINEGMICGPRVYAGSRFISTYGSISDPEPSWTGSPEHSLGVLANSLTEMITEVRRQCKHGVDLIKIADSTWGDSLTLSQEELTAVVAEAHRRNTRVTIHARGAGATFIAAQSGVDWIMHADLATEADLAAVAEKQIPIMPTLTALDHFITNAKTLGIPAKELTRMKYNFDSAVNNLRKFKSFGIPVMCGTDTGNSPSMAYGVHHASEPEMLVRYGEYSPLEAIQACTANNAASIGLEGEAGIIKAGAIADLLIYDKDPSADISTLGRQEHLLFIMKDGEIYKNRISPSKPRGDENIQLRSGDVFK